VPSCYLLAIAAGSSLDQQSNNITLFNLVEQVNVPPGVSRSLRQRIPLEIHAYFRLGPEELNHPIEVRSVLVARTGLETYSEPNVITSPTPRFRTRTFGVPFPPVPDQYELRVEWRSSGRDAWRRDPAAWPLTIVEHVPAPKVTH
jgi:hypothetical protein